MEKQNETITINIEPFLMPIAIIFSAIILAGGFIIGTNNLAGKVTTGATVIPTSVNAAAGENLVAGAGESVTGTVESLVNTATSIGVDSNTFRSCLENRETEAEVKADLADGAKAGISGTPGFAIGKLSSDGSISGAYLVSGALPADVFQNMVDGISEDNQDKISAVKTQYAQYITENINTTIDNDPYLGDKSQAKVAIVEFTDFDCTFCQRHHKETYPTILANLVQTNKAIYVIRDFPLSIHEPSATTKSVAAECVYKIGGNEKYFEFVDKLFV